MRHPLTIISILGVGYLFVQVIAQTETTSKTNTSESLVTVKYLPEVIKDDLIRILHVHNVLIKTNVPPQDNDYINDCKGALERLAKTGESLLLKESGFERPNNSFVDDIFNITDLVTVKQKEVSQGRDKAVQFAQFLNENHLEKYLNVVMTGCQSFSENVTQFVSR